MKDTFLDANFPKSADGRVYHLGLRLGEVANRIITVGPPSRAEDIARYLDGGSKNVFRLTSERAFHTITGRYKGVPISIISIGMGASSMDFFVREIRECVTGDLLIIRLGSCGCLDAAVPVGSLVVPSASVAVNRNYDFDFSGIPSYVRADDAYLISKPVSADLDLNAALQNALTTSSDMISEKVSAQVKVGTVNASADSFYSSQGRITAFSDHNENLIDRLIASVPGLTSLEMETFHLLHLASVWQSIPKAPLSPTTIPPTNLPIDPTISPGPSSQQLKLSRHDDAHDDGQTEEQTRIRAAAVHIVFANRITQDFIAPEQAEKLQKWAGEKVLQTLGGFEIDEAKLHPEAGSVWEAK